MTIWFDGFPLDYANERAKDSLIARLGIEVVEAGNDYLKARMPVDHRTKQPAGVLHGGASVALAETLASWAAAFAVDRTKHHCVGIEINANHLRPASGGYVTGIARPVQLGKTLHVWEVRISDEKEKLVCISRVTLAVLDSAMRY
jgi:1,4-dihydroxy-2-naphthoyl-CoA hydrolase